MHEKKIKENNKYLFVDPQDQQYKEVMTSKLNICSTQNSKC